ncbi:MAG TPA: hypothetical protein VFJ82_20655 [Longimicrobium sp.]|nr:hypothetical protein [Longimicrobium sp.]
MSSSTEAPSPPYAQNIAALRGEWSAISQKISRFCLFSLFVLFMLYLLGNRAYRSIHNDVVNEKVETIYGLSALSGHLADLPEFIEQYAKPPGPRGRRAPTEAERDSAYALQSALQDELATIEKQAGQALLVDYKLWGVTIPLDLRDFAILLPLIFTLSLTYLAILRQKADAVERLLALRVAAAPPAEPTDLDRLQFGRAGVAAFARHPGQLQGFLFYLLVFAFFAIAGTLLLPFWDELVSDRTFLLMATLPGVQIIGLGLYYAVCYASVVNRAIRRQAWTAYRLYGPEGPAPRLVRRLAGAAARIARGRWTRPALPLGSVGGAATVFLFVAATANRCGDGAEPRTGYALLARPGVYWYSSTLQYEGHGVPLHALGTAAYALLLAGIAAMVAVAGVGFLRRRRAPGAGRLATLFLCIAAFLTVDYGLSLGFFAHYTLWPKLVLTGLAVWGALRALRMRRRVSGRERVLWTAVYAPIVLYAAVFLGVIVVDQPALAFGLAVLWTSSILLWLGARRLASAPAVLPPRRRAARPPKRVQVGAAAPVREPVAASGAPAG